MRARSARSATMRSAASTSRVAPVAGRAKSSSLIGSASSSYALMMPVNSPTISPPVAGRTPLAARTKGRSRGRPAAARQALGPSAGNGSGARDGRSCRAPAGDPGVRVAGRAGDGSHPAGCVSLRAGQPVSVNVLHRGGGEGDDGLADRRQGVAFVSLDPAGQVAVRLCGGYAVPVVPAVLLGLPCGLAGKVGLDHYVLPWYACVTCSVPQPPLQTGGWLHFRGLSGPLEGLTSRAHGGPRPDFTGERDLGGLDAKHLGEPAQGVLAGGPAVKDTPDELPRAADLSRHLRIRPAAFVPQLGQPRPVREDHLHWRHRRNVVEREWQSQLTTRDESGLPVALCLSSGQIPCKLSPARWRSGG